MPTTAKPQRTLQLSRPAKKSPPLPVVCSPQPLPPPADLPADTSEKLSVTLPRAVVSAVLDQWEIYDMVMGADGDVRFAPRLRRMMPGLKQHLAQWPDRQSIEIEAGYDTLRALTLLAAMGPRCVWQSFWPPVMGVLGAYERRADTGDLRTLEEIAVEGD